MSRPLAYHITWGTYGTRLHGDGRGTVDREHNEYGTPVLGPDPERQRRRIRAPQVPTGHSRHRRAPYHRSNPPLDLRARTFRGVGQRSRRIVRPSLSAAEPTALPATQFDLTASFAASSPPRSGAR